jgi:hypothetical protein
MGRFSVLGSEFSFFRFQWVGFSFADGGVEGKAELPQWDVCESSNNRMVEAGFYQLEIWVTLARPLSRVAEARPEAMRGNGRTFGMRAL